MKVSIDKMAFANKAMRKMGYKLRNDRMKMLKGIAHGFKEWIDLVPLPRNYMAALPLCWSTTSCTTSPAELTK